MDKSRLLGALCACVASIFSTTSGAAVLALESRLGGLAYYDPNLDITWSTSSNVFEAPGGLGGFMNWDQATTAVANLTIAGVGDWRLPYVDKNNDGVIEGCSGPTTCKDNEFAYLYHEEGITSLSPGPFTNVLANYWSNNESMSDPNKAYYYNMRGDGFGVYFEGDKTIVTPVWAVHDGDVGAVPVPAALWLFGTGLLGMIGIARRK